MSFAITYSRGQWGLEAPLVTVETHITGGLPRFTIVGLPETAVKESKDRVRSALINSGFHFPNQRITVNLAPADLPKLGGRFDLAIAIGILLASKQLQSESSTDYELVGELALSGQLHPIAGLIPFAIATREAGKQLILPQASITEIPKIPDLQLFPASHLTEVVAHLAKQQALMCYQPSLQQSIETYPDLNEVKGQIQGKRALTIAAAGGHSLLMVGPPGTGKTMLANRLPGLLPPLTLEQQLEVAAITSLTANYKITALTSSPPFRAPHHSASTVAIVGGGNPITPGEISYAHHGVLFLDELPEFNRCALESLREPLESATISIARAKARYQFPANFQLIATMNPCPCGQSGNPKGHCQCSEAIKKRYQGRISGPILDRIDLQLFLQPLSPELIFTSDKRKSESSQTIREKVIAAREKQLNRIGKLNSNLSEVDIKNSCALSQEGKQLLEKAFTSYQFSARALQRLLKVARTIADLAAHESIAPEHLAEALSFRIHDWQAIYQH